MARRSPGQLSRGGLPAQPHVERDSADRDRAERGERSHAEENADKHDMSALAPGFSRCPADLPVDIGADGA